ncbi:MAG: DNA adenine methylase, partial [Thaumarchaeota archaeon]|nr:DNA adenine methylase [Nitrososphaerota archaeon]
YYGEAQPAEDKGSGKLVNAFTKKNAMKADAIREVIECMKPSLEHWEYMTLITSLIMALNKVQNSQGHSRAFFRDFMKQCHNPLKLELPPLVGNDSLSFSSDTKFLEVCPVGVHFTGDVLSSEYQTFVKQHSAGKKVIAYLDPPYTTNLPYNQFYHLWDSIVRWDKPSVIGATNRRIDRSSQGDAPPDLDSLWTKRNHAKEAFERLFTNLNFVDAFVISYSDESILSYKEMLKMFESNGFELVHLIEKEYQRHAMSKTATASEETRKTAHSHNTEWTFLVKKVIL